MPGRVRSVEVDGPSEGAVKRTVGRAATSVEYAITVGIAPVAIEIAARRRAASLDANTEHVNILRISLVEIRRI